MMFCSWEADGQVGASLLHISQARIRTWTDDSLNARAAPSRHASDCLRQPPIGYRNRHVTRTGPRHSVKMSTRGPPASSGVLPVGPGNSAVVFHWPKQCKPHGFTAVTVTHVEPQSRWSLAQAQMVPSGRCCPSHGHYYKLCRSCNVRARIL